MIILVYFKISLKYSKKHTKVKGAELIFQGLRKEKKNYPRVMFTNPVE